MEEDLHQTRPGDPAQEGPGDRWGRFLRTRKDQAQQHFMALQDSTEIGDPAQFGSPFSCMEQIFDKLLSIHQTKYIILNYLIFFFFFKEKTNKSLVSPFSQPIPASSGKMQ